VSDPKPKRVTDLLTDRFDSFSKSQKAVARYIIDHLEETGYLSADELARHGNTSSSTVVRFAQSLGFSGYPALQKAVRDQHRLGANARPVVHDDQLLFMVEEDILTRSLRTDGLSLEETIAKNGLDAFNRAVAALTEARRVIAVAFHESGPVVQHAAYLMELLGTDSWAVSDGAESNVARVAGCGAGDVVLAVGFREAHPITIHFVDMAKKRGASVVVITDNSLSGLADKGDVVLYADIDSASFGHSLVAPLSLVGALAGGVYANDREAHDQRFRQVRDESHDSTWLK